MRDTDKNLVRQLMAKKNAIDLAKTINRLNKKLLMTFQTIAFYRIEMWSDAEDDSLAHLKIAYSDEDGAIVKFTIKLNLNTLELAANKKFFKCMRDNGVLNRTIVSMLYDFLCELTDLGLNFEIDRLFFDIENYHYAPELVITPAKNGSYRVFVKYFSETTKDKWLLKDSAKAIGKDLASF